MKNLLLTLTLLAVASTTTANDAPKTVKLFMTDYKCMQDCMAKGYMYGYCQRVCEY